MSERLGMVMSLAAAIAMMAGAVGHSAARLEPVQPRLMHERPQASPLEGLAFMSGCWRGQLGGSGGTIEEHYSTPTSNMIIGMTRFVRGGRTVDFEFARIEARDSSVVLMPQPRGRPPTEFRLTSSDSISAVWENPTHDFPQRISYRRLGADSIAAAIAGPGPNGTRTMEWRMARVQCS